MLIRHNVRKGGNQSVHFAHDTDRPDVNGCYVSGRQGRVLTSENSRCPQCGGYGAVVPIQDLPRAQYPQGSVVPEHYRVNKSQSATVPASEPVPAVPGNEPVEPTFDPATGTVTLPPGHSVSDPTPFAVVNSEPVPGNEPVPATHLTDDQAARDMAAAMLGAIVPEANKIRETITTAVQEVKEQTRDENTTAIGNAIDLLSERFDDTVKRLIVPTTIEIKRPDAEPVVIAGSVHAVFPEVVEWLQARRNVYLTGPAGCGKTTLAKQAADALGIPFYTTGTVLSEHQVIGYSDAGGTYHTTPYREAFGDSEVPDIGGLWLGDEWDAWSPEATLAANSGLANRHASFPDRPDGVDASERFYCIAAANTWGNGADREYVGRNEMDAATLSRFVTVPMDYDRALEAEIAGPYNTWLEMVWRVRDNARNHSMRIMAGTRELVHGVAALNSGMDAERVVTRVLRRNLTDQEWARVTA